MKNDASVHIIFPPQFEPFQPYLSGAYLKALLSLHGVSSSFFDANIDFYEWFVQHTTVSHPRWAISDNEDIAYLRESVNGAISTIRQPPRSLMEYRWAINVVDQYLNASCPTGVELGLTQLKIGNRHSSADLRVYLNGKENIFLPYFDAARDAIIGGKGVETYLFSLVVLDQLPAALTFSREIKRVRKNARIIVGGPLVSRLHLQLKSANWIASMFDAIVPGEAYRTLPSVLPLSGAYSGHVSPDFSDYDLDRYWSPGRVLPYLVAHGCKWGKCTFCSHHLTYDGYRSSGMADVVADLARLFRHDGASYITFCDEYLTPTQLFELATGLIDKNIDLKWSTFVRPEAAFRNPALLHKMYAAGCRMLMFGLESGSQRILKAMKKGTRLEHFRPILEACKAANIAVRYDFMVGFPGETEEDARATYEFVSDNRDVVDTPFSSYAVAAFELRSGVPVHEQATRYGVRVRLPLRGDLDDQYEFDDEGGVSEETRAKWRARLIQLSKLELDIELLCPQNKTHQLVLKALFDNGAFDLPVRGIHPDDFPKLGARFARGVRVHMEDRRSLLSNHANGGKLDIDPRLNGVLRALGQHVSLKKAFDAQRIWDERTFADFLSFAYRNDHVEISTWPQKSDRGAHAQ